MLLAMDVGNTNIKLALFDGKEMRSSWRISATITRTAESMSSSALRVLALAYREGDEKPQELVRQGAER